MEFIGEQEKIHYLCEDGIEKPFHQGCQMVILNDGFSIPSSQCRVTLIIDSDSSVKITDFTKTSNINNYPQALSLVQAFGVQNSFQRSEIFTSRKNCPKKFIF